MVCHFFVLRRRDGRSFFLTLPGQTLGRDGRAVTLDIIVKPRKDAESRFRRLRKDSPDGAVFVTRSLRRENGCYSAGDIDSAPDAYRNGSSTDPDTVGTE